MEGVHTRIKELRKAKQMTQDELAQATGLHRVTIARYEVSDGGMTLESARRIASALGCTVEELTADTATEQPA